MTRATCLHAWQSVVKRSYPKVGIVLSCSPCATQEKLTTSSHSVLRKWPTGLSRKMRPLGWCSSLKRKWACKTSRSTRIFLRSTGKSWKTNTTRTLSSISLMLINRNKMRFSQSIPCSITCMVIHLHWLSQLTAMLNASNKRDKASWSKFIRPCLQPRKA